MYFICKGVGISLDVMEFGPHKYEFSLTHCLDFAISTNLRISHNSVQFKLKIKISLMQVKS